MSTTVDDLSLTLDQIEILILDQTCRNSNAYVARCKRRLDDAQREYEQAIKESGKAHRQLEERRNALLTRIDVRV